MSKQTVVQKIFEQMNLLSNSDFQSWMLNNTDELLLMEREQTVDAYCECWMMDGGNGNHKVKEANEYYNKTFGGEE